MNTPLAQRQHELLEALLQPHPPAPCAAWHGSGLGAYRANAHAHAERALRDAYPVIAALIGEDAFHALARALWHHHPPERGDLSEWGGAMAAFIAAQSDLDSLPYLSDVARLEWALQVASRAADATPDPPSFAWFEREPPEHLRLRLAPGTAIVRSPWPVLSVLDAHLHGEPDFGTVARRLSDGVAESVRVWRQGAALRLTPIDGTRARFEAALLDGHTLGQALDDTPLDPVAWLSEAIRTGLCVGVVPPSAAIDTEGEHPCPPPP